MEKKKILIAGGAGILAIAAWFYFKKKRSNVIVANSDSEDSGFYDVPMNGMNIPGYVGGDFISNISVSANPELLSMLNNKYMPLFGFVGTTTVSVPVYVPVKPVKNKCPAPPKPRNNYIWEFGKNSTILDWERYQINPEGWCKPIRETSMAPSSQNYGPLQQIRSL